MVPTTYNGLQRVGRAFAHRESVVALMSCRSFADEGVFPAEIIPVVDVIRELEDVSVPF